MQMDEPTTESELIILLEGDKRIRWRRDADSEEKARRTFIEKIDAGWTAFRRTPPPIALTS